MPANHTKRLFAFSTLVIAVTAATPVLAQSRSDDACANARDLTFVNGQIHTMDARDTIVTTATIRNGRFTAVGRKDAITSPCTRVIDLQGRTVVPGLVDNHNHFVLLSLRPGYDTRIESTASVAEVQAAVAARAKNVPEGQFITAIGGWNPIQFAEKRLPVKTELDAAAPIHPFYMQVAFAGPSATNSLGITFFRSKGVAVDDNGQIAGGPPSIAALNALRALQTMDDKKRGTLDAMTYSASFGLTTNVDMGGFIVPGTPDVGDSEQADGAASWNPYTAYDALIALHREGKTFIRVRLNYLTMDKSPDVPTVKARVLNGFDQFGDGMLKVTGMGEFLTNWVLGPGPLPTNFDAALKAVAERGWIFQQHSLSLNEDKFIADAFERLNAKIPLAPLHWSVGHVTAIDRETVDRFKALDVGLALHGTRYINGQGLGGPPYRMILDSGVRTGGGSDSAQVATLNPWLVIYFMVTGKNAGGQVTNPGQQITRAEALRLYTSSNGWFIKEESDLGAIEEGKYGDLAVLSDDVFDAAKVPDEAIKQIKSMLTVVDGKVVHRTMN